MTGSVGVLRKMIEQGGGYDLNLPQVLDQSAYSWQCGRICAELRLRIDARSQEWRLRKVVQ